MISLNDIYKIKCKVVISLHDMWFLNSTEHYADKKKEDNDFISNYCLKKKTQIVLRCGFVRLLYISPNVNFCRIYLLSSVVQ